MSRPGIALAAASCCAALLLVACPAGPSSDAPSLAATPADAPSADVPPAPSAEPRTPAPAREPILVLPVPDKAREGDADFAADWSFDIQDRPWFSVHVHVIPPGQMVPLHHHPDNWELSWVAAGRAEWWTVRATPTGQVREDGGLGPGEGFVAPPGAFHGVRNRSDELLAVVVVHRPRFGQNWYVPESEVVGNIAAFPLPTATGPLPVDAPEGWRVEWVDDGTVTAEGDRVLLAASAGAVAFEETTVSLEPGAVAVFPPGVAHTLTGRALSVSVPRP